MWTAEEMEAICHALRAETEGRDDPEVDRQTADDEFIDQMEQEVEEYRDWYAKHLMAESIEDSLVPPDELRECLWLIGWMIYEATWQIMQDARADGGAEINERPGRLIRRLTEVTRHLPWPHFAPRALGAIRADALVESKRDTTLGYAKAFLLHKEARERHDDYVANHGSAPGRELERLGLDEIYLQLVLAETGTACRTAERIIGRWLDELAKGESVSQWVAEDEDHWVQMMFKQLSLAVEIGERALDIAGEIERVYGFTKRVNRRRLALRTAYRNPGIMTARAALLLLPLSYEMEALGLRPASDYENWAEMREATVQRFRRAYEVIEKPLHDDNGAPVPLFIDHQRSVVQLRLNAALVLPGLDLPSTLDFGDCLEHNPLDALAVEELSAWLAESDAKGQPRGNANVIGSATLPAFIRGVRACRDANGAPGGYRAWRQKWYELDRYFDERDDARRQRVWQALE